ncbi:MAG: hypothetical protein ACP5FK_01905 [bacterium]
MSMLWKLPLILTISFIVSWISYRSLSVPAVLRFLSVSLILSLLFYPRLGKFKIIKRETAETVLVVDGELDYWLDWVEEYRKIDKFILTEDTAVEYPFENMELTNPGRAFLNLLYLLNKFPGTLVWITKGEKFDQMSEDIFQQIPQVYIYCDNPINRPHLEIGLLGGKQFINRNEQGWVKFSVINNYAQPDTFDFEIRLDNHLLNNHSLNTPLIIPGYSRKIISSLIDPVQQNLQEGSHQLELMYDHDRITFNFWINHDDLNVDLIADNPHWSIGKLRRVLVKEPRLNFRGTVRGLSENYVQFTPQQEHLVNAFPDLSPTQLLFYIGNEFSPSYLQNKRLILVVWLMTKNLETDIEQFYPVQLTEQGMLYPFTHWLGSGEVTGNYLINASGQNLLNFSRGEVLTTLNNFPQMVLFNIDGIYLLAVPASQFQSWHEQGNSDKIDSMVTGLINWSRSQSRGELSLFVDQHELSQGHPLNITAVSDSFSEVWIRKIPREYWTSDDEEFWMVQDDENYLIPARIDSGVQFYQAWLDSPGNYLILGSRGKIRAIEQVQVKPQLFYLQPQYRHDNYILLNQSEFIALLETLPEVNVDVEIEATVFPQWLIGLILIGLLMLEWFLKYRRGLNNSP